ncbi:MAG: disulfide isomerase, partial [Betaproteobacteria bacterium]|nr:disulfide isomerase [Betaproteobacteria bacterium]
VGWPTELINRLAPAGSAERAPLSQHWAAALDRLSRDTTLSRGDRIDALGARIEVAKLLAGTAPLDPELLRQVRDIVARIDLDTTNPYERQAVIPSAGHVLADAGLLHDSDALLTAELPRAIAPYYHMLVLASNDRKRGDKAGALEWYEKAYGQSRGPATRLQWGATYVSALVELAPQDARQIDHVVSQIIAELPPQADTFYERNQRALQRIGRVLDQWNAKGAHTALVQQLHGKLGLVCRKLPPGDAARAQCDSAFDAPAASART